MKFLNRLLLIRRENRMSSRTTDGFTFLKTIGEKTLPFNKRTDRLATYQDLFPNRLD